MEFGENSQNQRYKEKWVELSAANGGEKSLIGMFQENIQYSTQNGTQIELRWVKVAKFDFSELKNGQNSI